MERILDDVEPKLVFKYFEDLTRIPRDSGNEEMVCEYLFQFAQSHGFEYYKDEAKNVLLKVPATKGYENKPVVIIQGHMDMVCEKNEGTSHDFTREPISFEVEDDKIIAKETTLGADDGIGIAFALALAADETACHPPLEIVCTSDEERGMTGAEAFDTGLLKGRTLVNLDADDEGIFIAGSAGGPVIRIEIPIVKEKAVDGMKALHISVKGLMGGHSGEDIHRGRANANKLLNRILAAVGREVAYSLSDISGGLKYNAIPREASAIIYVGENDIKKTVDIVNKMEGAFKAEYYSTEPGLYVTAGIIKGNGTTLNEDSKNRINDFIMFSECGIIRMHAELEGVESSVSVGTVRLEGDNAVILTMTRSSVESIYMDTYYKVIRLAEMMGGTTEIMSNCPEWEFNPKSKIIDLFSSVYEELFCKKAKILVLHAGLECGVIGKKIPEYVDMIAAGPDIRNLHTVGEYVTISSVQKFWKLFKEVFKRL